MKSSPVTFWTQAQRDLQIEVVAPFEVLFSDGSRLRVDALVKDFGAPKGMLVHQSYDLLKPFVGRILEDGYGYSSNVGDSPYEKGAVAEILKDWGWSGPEGRKPAWLGG
jgi:hypothetical protein